MMLQETSRSDLFYAPALAVLCLFVVPIFVLASNAVDLSHFDALTTIGALALLSLAAVALLFGLAVGARRLGLSAALLPLRFAFFFFLAAGLFLPLTTAGGQVEIYLLPVDRTNLLLALGVASLLFAASFTPARGALLFGVVACLVATALNSSISAYQGLLGRTSNAIEIASSTENLFVVSFDGLSRDISNEILHENADLQDALRDFTVFENVASNAPATFASIMTEISGLPDLKERFDTQAKTLAALEGSPQLLTNRLNRAGVTVSTYGSYIFGFEEPTRRFARATLVKKSDARARVSQVGELLSYAIARMLSPALVPTKNPADWLVERIGGYLPGQAGSLVRQVERHSGAAWDAANVLEVLDFEHYVSHLHVRTDKPVAHFLHFTHTHFPIDFDRSCKYRSNDKRWHRANQNRAALKAQTECALNQFRDFLAKLKTLGIYDTSLVVFKSDHGEPVRYNDPARLESFTVRGHPNWGVGRYIPFLAIKVPGQKAEGPVFDQRPVALGDLALSLCRALLDTEGKCSDFQGYDIASPQTVIPKNATYSLDIVKSASSDFRMDSHELIRIPRAPGVLQSLNDFMTSELLSVAPDCQAEIVLAQGDRYNNGLTDRQRWVTWRNGSVSNIKTLRPTCAATRMAIDLKEGAAVVNVSVNGEAAAFELTGTGGAQLMVTLPPIAGDARHVILAIDAGAGATTATMIKATFLDQQPLGN